MGQKRKATNDEAIQPSKKAKTDNKVDRMSKPKKAEAVQNTVESSDKTSAPASKVKSKKNRNSSGNATLQESNKIGQTKDGLSSKVTGECTVNGRKRPSSGNKSSSIHLPGKPEEVSCNWKQLLKSGKVVYNNKKTSQKRDSSEKQEKFSNSKKSNEIWFDGVDEILIETGRIQEPASIEKSKANNLVKPNAFEGLTKVVAMDCEMVGVGLEGKESMLARVSIVNHFGRCLYDKYVKPVEKVTDYRTFVSGIRPSNLKHAEDFKTVQKEVSEILNGRTLVGHAIHNDFKVLFLDHPRKKIRDTSRYKPFRALFSGGIPSLKNLSEKLLGVKIQDGEHSSVQDAQAAMRLYTMHRKKWEQSIKKKK